MQLSVNENSFKQLGEARNQFAAMPFLFRVNVDIAGRGGVASLVRRKARARINNKTGLLKRSFRIRRDAGEYEGRRVSNFVIEVRAGGRSRSRKLAYYGIFVDQGTKPPKGKIKGGQRAQRFLSGVPDRLTDEEVTGAYVKSSQRRMERFYKELQSGQVKRSTQRLFSSGR